MEEEEEEEKEEEKEEKEEDAAQCQRGSCAGFVDAHPRVRPAAGITASDPLSPAAAILPAPRARRPFGGSVASVGKC